MIHGLRLVAAFHDYISGVERRCDITGVDIPFPEQVPLSVNGGRGVCQRHIGIENPRQLLVVDLHQVARLSQRVLGLRDNQGHWLTVEADPVGRQDLHAGFQRCHLDRLAWDVDPDDVVRNVLAEQHADDSRHSERRSGVATDNPRRRQRGTHQAAMEHARESEIPGVPRRARDLLPLVVPGERLPHDLELVLLRRPDPGSFAAAPALAHRTAPC